MLKPLLFFAVTANLFFIITVEADRNRRSTTSSATATASATVSGCDHDDHNVRCKGPNEVFDKCPAPCPPQRCDVDITVILCRESPKPGDPDCKPGCRCINGHVRNSSNICIPRAQCEPQCGKNERYEKCPAFLCGPQKCSELGYGVNHTSTDKNKPCPVKPGCVCKNGYLRNDKGECIPQKQCPTCKGDSNAEPGCGTYCNQRCSSIGQKPGPCILKCKSNACDCKKGYFLDDNQGICVLPKDCTPTCGRNEVYTECSNGGCDAKKCSELGYPVPCVKPKRCIKGCVCKNGYLRNSKGVCIPRSQCPSCGGDKNAQPGCGARCKRCSNYNKGPVACPLICILNSCDCKKGYIYDDNTKKCVRPKDCSPVCGANEVYNKCISKSTADKNKCSALGFDLAPDKDSKNCTQGCLCKEGYLRDANNVCIPKEKCPSCGGDSRAKPGCGVNCGKHCADYFGDPLPCKRICYPNGCDCKDGYYYDDNQKKCVLPKQCTPYCRADKNLVYSNCTNGGCDAKNCSQLVGPVPCVKLSPGSCIKGCICKKGYLRDSNGSCIPKDQCNPCKRPNEYFDKCPSTCPPQTCDSLERMYACPIIPSNSTKGNCKPACRCKEGYYRNKIGECISKANCLKCMTGRNEYYSCGSACDNECDKIDTQSQDNCPIKNIVCNKRCYCEKGYARAKNNTCIEISRCKEPQCDVNERYETCPAALCRPENCSEVGFPKPCPKVGPKCPGKPKCVCNDGYVRNGTGPCIPVGQCPSCRGDRYARAGCGFCGQRCSDIGKSTVCPAVCEVNGCRCIKGYFYDTVQKKCVLPKDCTPECGKNEQYSKCPAGICRPKSCSQLGFPINCSFVAEGEECPGKPGCICNEGYVKNNKGICVPLIECPSCGGDRNATAGCGYCGQRCSDIGKTNVPCPRIACRLNGCQCKEGYFYDSIKKKCVRPDDCTPSCGKNEVPSSCVNGGCDKRNCTQLGQPKLCINPFKCNKGCVCKPGYLRNPQNICVPIKECPSCGGDSNARPGCGNHCNRRCSDIGSETKVCTLECKVDGCDCIPGYYLDDITGKCVKPENCTSLCGKNEMFNNCIEGFCDAKTCGELGYPVACPDVIKCTKGCLCKVGYVKNKKGICIPKAECPSCGGDPRAHYGCGVNCGQRCRDVGKKNFKCQKMCNFNGCDCKPGYYLDENTGKCVPVNKCTPQCPKNEKYDKCIEKNCKPKKCSDLGFEVNCNSSIDTGSCTGGCLCVEGYVRASNGTCIPASDCPSCGGDDKARAGCGINCGKQCSQIGEDVGCIAVCLDNACDCIDGYYLNEYTGKCVLPDKCPPTCPKDEVYNSCVEAYCKPKTCSEVGFPINCTKEKKNCTEACLCKDGYVRDKNGKCILLRECPSCGGDKAAVPGCGDHCNRRCRDIGKKNLGACNEICKVNSCDCKPGYYFDENTEKCVKPQNCTPVCGEDEYYSNCIQAQCQVKNCSQLGYPIACPRVISAFCIKGCLCKDNKVRSANGTCIPRQQCPSCRGDSNAVSGCGFNTNKLCSDVGKNPKPCNDTCDPFINGCDCKDGYYLDPTTNKCVFPEQCNQCDDLDTAPDSSSTNVTELSTRVRRANIALIGQFVYNMVISKPGESFVLSGISVLIALMQLLLYSVGLTREQLLRVTNLESNEQVKQVIPVLLSNFRGQINVTFEEAVKFYGSIYYPFSEKFKKDAVQIFDSEGENLDFSKNVEAANTINKWVEEKTHDQIKDLIPASALSRNTRLVLLNALYFYGDWEKSFNINNTKNRDFYVTPNKTISIPMMYQENTFNYCEFSQIDIKVIELFYSNKNFSMIIWLPNKKDGLKDLVTKMRDPDIVTQTMECLSPEKVKVYIPKMDILTQLDVTDLLKKDNVTEMFNPDSDGFKCILAKYEPMYVSDAIQKCKIQSNEKGTLAAVATGIIISTRTAVIRPPVAKIFNADHPHAFAIFKERDPLFTGVFTAFFGVGATAVMAPPKIYEFNADHGHVFCVCFNRNPIFCGGFQGP